MLTANISTKLALKDLNQAIKNYPLWITMGWQDIKQRYRRSVLGPFWITLSMSILVATLGLIWGALFHQNMTVYLPYLTTGLVTWSLISSNISESCNGFIESAGYIKQIKLPLFTFILRVNWRNTIIFFHTLIIPFLVGFYFDIKYSWNLFFLVPGLIIISLNTLWMGLLLGIVSARYRDIPPIVMNLLQPLFYITPIIWHSDQLNRAHFIINYNPFYYFIEIIRAPLLGRSISNLSWEITLGITLVGWLITFLIFSRYRKRIVYWI